MTTATATVPYPSLAAVQSPRRLALHALVAILARDLTVVRKQFIFFTLRTVTQPLLFVFVFAYVFPKIGQGIGGSAQSASAFSTLLVPGIVASSLFFQGIQTVALPLVQEFGYTREIDDRVMAPLPVWGIAMTKMMSGAVQSGIAALMVIPFALLIPEHEVVLDINWVELVTIGVLACVMAGSFGLAVGTRFEPRQVPLIFSILLIPMTMLGAVYFPWQRLDAISWLKCAVLVNPLLYVSEGLRMATTPLNHMPTWAIYLALIGFTTFFMWLSIRGFAKRVLT